MKKLFLLIFFVNLFSIFNCAIAQVCEQCGTEILFRESAKKDPSLIDKRIELEAQTAKFILAKKRLRVSGVEPLRVIPVVVHVIHESGPENISKAQIEDQIRILNLDFRRLNSDTVDTPAPFKALGADCNIEFRLAKKDPTGKCTDGIVRVFSHRTNNANDTSNANEIKNLSAWDNSRYLNIWLVKSFTYNDFGTLLGYAQFPNGGKNSLDGVVILSSHFGSIGTATANNHKGRIASHEIGHWLNLLHIWGDAECGTDEVTDTPSQEDKSYNCPSFPQVTCGGADGDMFSNYMDYTNGSCQNIFTKGQKLRIDATLAGFRAKPISQSNLISTGTNDGYVAGACLPIPSFSVNYKTICQGTSVYFKDESYNGAPSNWSWTFEGGTPDVSTVQNTLVKYNSPGVYKVSLTVSNDAGSVTKTNEQMINVSATNPSHIDLLSENFEDASYPNKEWSVVNDDNGPTWVKTSLASFSGNGSIMISNFKGNFPNEIDELISPTVNLSNALSPMLTFRIAYGQKDPAYKDQLKVFYSKDCGKNWIECYSKSGNALAAQSGGLQYVNYVPKTAQEWRFESVAIDPLSNVRFKFQFLSGVGNNIYIDDINISKAVGITKQETVKPDFVVYPNPGNEHSMVGFNLPKEQMVELGIYDVLGRQANSIVQQKLPQGEYQFKIGKVTQSGVYFLRLKLDETVFIKKLIITLD